jgi:hypothetical protein
MVRKTLLFVGVLGALALVALAQSEEETRPLRIGDIELVINNVFEEGKEDVFSWAYRFGNKIHIRTREDVVRSELLFGTGDVLDKEALEQTERNLRGLTFIRDARVETYPAEGGKVNIRVTTYDSWTLVPQIRFAKSANRIVWTLGVAERNLFGYGKWVDISRRSGLDRDETVFFYFDPRLAGSRTQTLVSYANQSDGRRGLFQLTRPFFALSTGWAFGIRLEGFDQLDPLYRDGERVEDLRHIRKHGDFEAARAVIRSGPRAARFHIAYRRHRDDVEGDLRDFGILELGFSLQEHRFLKLDHINRFEATEDFNLGYEAAAFVGVSAPALGGEDGTSWFYSLRGRRGFGFGPAHFLLAGAAWNARYRRDNWENSLASARLDYVFRQTPRWLLVGTAQLLYGRNLDPEIQIRLGAESGLRGYPVRQFVGDRSFRVTLEERFFIADDVAQLVSFAVAAFVDTGYAWPESQNITASDIKTNVGVSLLLGRNRLAGTTPGVRFDIAYALDPIDGVGRWQFSVGSRIAL